MKIFFWKRTNYLNEYVYNLRAKSMYIYPGEYSFTTSNYYFVCIHSFHNTFENCNMASLLLIIATEASKFWGVNKGIYMF